MGWLDKINEKKKDKVPEMFKDKSEDDILTMLEAASKDKQKLQELEQKDKDRETEVGKIQTQFEEVKARLAAAESKPKPKASDTDEELPDFVTEPDKAFGSRVAPIADIAIRNAAITSRMLAQQMLDNQDMASQNKTMDGRLFRAWSQEIDTHAKKYQMIQLSSPEGWLGIFYYLKGVHADELRDPETRKQKFPFLEPAAASFTPSTQDKKDDPNSLTDAEKKVADKMGVTYENYLKRKKSMAFVTA